jgi:hypothetical protein
MKPALFFSERCRIYCVAERKDASEFVGEFLREVAVLIFTLYPLEAYLERRFNFWVFVGVIIFSGVMLAGGIMLGRREEQ